MFAAVAESAYLNGVDGIEILHRIVGEAVGSFPLAPPVCHGWLSARQGHGHCGDTSAGFRSVLRSSCPI